MMKVMPFDPSHEEVYNAFIMKTQTEPKTEVFFCKTYRNRPTGNILKP